ncbi:hypothetical protein EG352_07345 [Chryseobacterium indologenes]|uniref:Uncharacterized protein n=1 Tax=Chryseobacterium indologenes TaxID=253 RepID=A0AAD1DUY6_CHRID|nr:hypothetical protein [Chryseobacterium indologenes]AZB17594.1 hypothetical protein EG352_07345 [Chryseobacterium indologenes]
MRNRERECLILIDDYDYGFEMPTPCDCGEWFDLHDGYGSKTKNVTICSNCHEIEEEIEDFQNEIDELKTAITNGENRRQNKKQLKLVKMKLKEKQSELIKRKF